MMNMAVQYSSYFDYILFSLYSRDFLFVFPLVISFASFHFFFFRFVVVQSSYVYYYGCFHTVLLWHKKTIYSSSLKNTNFCWFLAPLRIMAFLETKNEIRAENCIKISALTKNIVWRPCEKWYQIRTSIYYFKK